MWSIYEIIHICIAVGDEVKSDHRIKFKELERRSMKKSELQRDSNPWTPRYRCNALATELWSQTLGARSIYCVHIFPCSEVMWSIYEIIHICTAVVDEVKSDHRSKFSNLSNWKEEAWKNQGLKVFEPVTSAIPVQCSSNWAMKPNIGSEVNLLRSYFSVQWSDVKYIWKNTYLYCGCRWSEEWSSQ